VVVRNLVHLSVVAVRPLGGGLANRKAAYFAILGFVAILATWGTNSGMHSFVFR
jgi:hypothetical protein